MIKVWWSGLNTRERRLVLAAAALAGVIGFLQLLLAPVTAARERAERAYANAADDFADVRAGVARVAGSGGATPAGSAPGAPLRAAVADTALRLQLQIARVQPLETGALTITLDDVSPQTLFRWILLMRDEHGVSVQRATITRNQARPTVRANLVLTPAAAP